MDRIVRLQHFERYRQALSTVRDEDQRLRLLKLLEEEEAKEASHPRPNCPTKSRALKRLRCVISIDMGQEQMTSDAAIT